MVKLKIFLHCNQNEKKKEHFANYRVTRVYGSSQGVNSDIMAVILIKEAINTGTQYLHYGAWWFVFGQIQSANLSDIATLNNQTYLL